MDIRFDGKVAVVTGGAGGIGRSIVRTLAEGGATVVIVDIAEPAITKAIQELSDAGSITGYVANLGNAESIAPLVEKIRTEVGEIDILVQAAGMMGGSAVFDITIERWDAVQNANARGLFFMLQQVALQSMKARGGAVVNFASMAGIRGMNIPMCAAEYSASKGAVVAITMQEAVELAPYGIRVNAIAPGGVATPAMKAMGFPPEAVDPIPLKQFNDPQDVANLVAFLVSQQARMITGQTIVIDGGVSVVGD